MKFNIPKKYYTLNEIASEWECSTDEILDYAEQGLLQIYARCNEGAVDVFFKDGTSKNGLLTMSYNLPGDNLYPISGREVQMMREVDRTFEYDDPAGHLFITYKALPVRAWRGIFHEILTSEKSRKEVKSWHGTFHHKDLRIRQEEKKRFERKADENRNTQTLQNKNLAPQNKDLSPTVGSSLLKMILGMAVDGYGYEPTDKRSPTTNEIVQAVAVQDLTITDDTVRKWLKKAKMLPKDLPIRQEKKERFERKADGNRNTQTLQNKDLAPTAESSLLKMVLGMAVDAYGYEPNDKESPTPNEIVQAVAVQDLTITDDIVKKWLKKAKMLPKDLK